MKPNQYEIWAKSKLFFKDENSHVISEKIITLSEHIKDVLKAFDYFSKYVSKKNKEVLPDYLKSLIILVIEYHDIAKVLPYFQINTLKNKDYRPFDVYANIPHSLLSALMVDVDALKETIASVLNNKETAETYTKYVLSAIAYHHWRESFFDIIEGYSNVFEPLEKLLDKNEKWELIGKNIEQAYQSIRTSKKIKPYINRKWLNGLNNGIKYADYIIPPYNLYRMSKRLELKESSQKDWVLMSGFTMLSDHFASYVEGKAEKDISMEHVEIEGLSFDQTKTKIATELQIKIGKNFKDSEIWQFNLVEKYKDANTILLAPTGMGKTEFSFLWSNGDKFFYTLPLRSAVNQIYDRTASIFGKNKAGILHSDADVYIYGDGAETESMRVYELARQLSSPAIISTGDQFFPYALRPPSYERIFAKFSYSRLIIDEVQAYDPKAAAIVVKFIEHIVQMGGKFLLMTATLPNFIKKAIEERVDMPNVLDLFKEDSNLAEFRKHQLEFIIEPYADNKLSYSKETIQSIINKSKENGGSRVLVVLNTVKQAQAVYEDLKKQGKSEVEIKLFHSRYTQKDRKKTEDELAEFIGNNDKSRATKKANILVATQVVEASLDLDADFLFTELSPWDSLIQRMGRVLREYRINTINAQELINRRYVIDEIPSNIFVIIYDGKNNKKTVFESGQGYVYHIELLRTTLKLIEKISDVDLKKWNNSTKPEIKLETIKKMEQFRLSEQQKSELVNRLFEGLPDESGYLKTFYGMLQLLDSGYMSDRKSEAQKAFREINDVSVISENNKESFFIDVLKFNFDEKYAYTRFKKEVVSKYVISVQRNKVKEFLYESNLIVNTAKTEDSITDLKVLAKLKNWLFGVYFVRLDYSSDGGLLEINENNGNTFV